jgi:hypothetical protein
MVFEVPILDLDPHFVKHVAKLMAHPVYEEIESFWQDMWPLGALS